MSITRSTRSKLRSGVNGQARITFTFLSGCDHEQVADGLMEDRCPACRTLDAVDRKHPVELRDVEVDVSDDRVAGRGALRLLDLTPPVLARPDGIAGQANDPHSPAIELRLDRLHAPELQIDHRREVFGVREQHRPRLRRASRGNGSCPPWCRHGSPGRCPRSLRSSLPSGRCGRLRGGQETSRSRPVSTS